MTTDVAVLFVTRDSIYKTLGCDCYDAQRNALTFPGGKPVVAHPPCRSWGKLRHCAKAPPGERDLAIWAVEQVRKSGGVLEHPLVTGLWEAAGLPEPAWRDDFGGFTLIVDQFWWGHRARKSTRLYMCGMEPRDVPRSPLRLGIPTHTVGLWSGRNKARCRPGISKAEYSATPIDFARWLLLVAAKTGNPLSAQTK